MLGRPHGGTAILWSKTLCTSVEIVNTNFKRVSFVKATISGFTILIASVYMPCDDLRIGSCNVEFMETLNSIEQCMYSEEFDCFILCGDWNPSFERNTAQLGS